MVQVVENLACIAGQVARVEMLPASSVAAPEPFLALSIRVEGVQEIAGHRNLVSELVGSTIAVRVRSSQIEAAEAMAGRVITLPISLVSPGTYIAHQDWRFGVMSPLCN